MAQAIPSDPAPPKSAVDAAAQAALQQRGALPKHIAIIMDGNGRWAKAQGKPRVFGHKEGVVSVRDIAEASAQLGVAYLTLYTFSTENWYRPLSEVNALMELLIRTLRKERKTFFDNNIRLQTIGDVDKLPPVCREELQQTIAETAGHTRMTLVLALSYSGRWDLVQAMQRLAAQVKAGSLAPEDITETHVGQALSTQGIPDPDLLVRTGGDFRVSNFLLWELAYSELVITQDYWPAFRRPQLYQAIEEFQDRERRFGRVLDPA